MQLIGFLAFVYIGMTIANYIMGGAFIAGVDIDMINTMAITRDQTLFGIWTVPVLNTDFFFTGLTSMVQWDYSYFSGNAVIFKYFLFSVTAALTFVIFIIIIGLIYQVFSRR